MPVSIETPRTRVWICVRCDAVYELLREARPPRQPNRQVLCHACAGEREPEVLPVQNVRVCYGCRETFVLFGDTLTILASFPNGSDERTGTVSWCPSCTRRLDDALEDADREGL